MYKPKDNKTLSLFPEIFPLGGGLNARNRWIITAELVPWRELEEIYVKYLSPVGRPATDARLVCGLLMVKWLEDFSDDRTLREYYENPYVQAFCGAEKFATGEDSPDPGILSRTRRRMGAELFSKFETEVLSRLAQEPELQRKFPKTSGAAPSGWRGIIAALKRIFSGKQ